MFVRTIKQNVVVAYLLYENFNILCYVYDLCSPNTRIVERDWDVLKTMKKFKLRVSCVVKLNRIRSNRPVRENH